MAAFLAARLGFVEILARRWRSHERKNQIKEEMKAGIFLRFKAIVNSVAT